MKHLRKWSKIIICFLQSNKISLCSVVANSNTLNRRIKISIISAYSIKSLPAFQCRTVLPKKGWNDLEKKYSTRKKLQAPLFYPSVEATGQNCPKTKVEITFRMINLQVTPLAKHFYGDGSILIQHWLDPVSFNTVSIYKRTSVYPG